MLSKAWLKKVKKVCCVHGNQGSCMGVKGQGHRSLGHLYNFSCLGYAVSMATSTKMEHTLLVWIQIEKSDMCLALI